MAATEKLKRKIEEEEPNPAKRLKLSMMPGETRNQIWRELLNAEMSSGSEATPQPYYLLSDDGEGVTVAQKQQLPKVNVQVSSIPAELALFKTSLARYDPDQYAEFFSEVSAQHTFTFTSPSSLEGFMERVETVLSVNSNLQFDPGCIELRIFANNGYRSLEGWQKPYLHHGFKEEAHRHIKQWMGAVQKVLPHKCPIRLVLHRPWRDYESLCGATRCLREAECKLEIWANPKLWQAYPSPERHQAITVAAIMGKAFPWQKDLDFETVKEWCSYGCRGVRGLW